MNKSNKRPLVLIIDDDDVNQTVLKFLLTKENIHCMMSENGQSGIELAKQYQPDIILLDIFMPDENGFEVLKWIKQNEQINHIPVFIFSILENELDIQNAYDIGADGYITKPFDMKDVVKKVREVISTGNS